MWRIFFPSSLYIWKTSPSPFLLFEALWWRETFFFKHSCFPTGTRFILEEDSDKRFSRKWERTLSLVRVFKNMTRNITMFILCQSEYLLFNSSQRKSIWIKSIFVVFENNSSKFLFITGRLLELGVSAFYSLWCLFIYLFSPFSIYCPVTFEPTLTSSIDSPL